MQQLLQIRCTIHNFSSMNMIYYISNTIDVQKINTTVERRYFLFNTYVITFPKTCVSSHVQTTILLLYTIRQLARQQMRVSTLSRVKFIIYYYFLTRSIERFPTILLRSFIIIILYVSELSNHRRPTLSFFVTILKYYTPITHTCRAFDEEHCSNSSYAHE